MPDIRIEVTRVLGSVEPFIAGQDVGVAPSVSRVIGDVEPFVAGQDVGVDISISRVIGDVMILAERATVRVRPSVARVIGTVAPALIGLSPALRVSLTKAIGPVRASVQASGSYWQPPTYTPPAAAPDEPYLPLIEMRGYQWQNEPNLVTTQMASGVLRQRQRRRVKLRQLNVQLKLTCRQLANLEELLTQVNSNWFRWPVLTGQSEGLITEHTVRITEIVNYTTDGDMFTVTLAIEALF